MEILGQDVGVNETWSYVGECDVQSPNVCQLRKGFEVCVAIALGGGVGGGGVLPCRLHPITNMAMSSAS